jgi:hypothetical protein
MEAKDGAFAATRALAGDFDSASSGFSRAFAIDRGSPSAKIGTGYCEFQRCVRALRDLFKPISASDGKTRMQELERDARRNHRPGIYRAMQTVMQQPVDSGDEIVLARGKGNGLAVTRRQGGLLGVFVHLVPRESIRVTRSEAAVVGVSVARGIRRVDYWAGWAEVTRVELKEPLVAFGDYGDKDLYMEAAAEEMCKWLLSAVPFDSNSKRLQIEFQEPFIDKAGDSAGATFAASGYSALTNIPLRAKVAMTGSVRASGSVAGVGGIPQKLDGASSADQIEVVIVPKENEPDLSCVPADQLCKLVIVTADNMKTYLKYALAPVPGNATSEQFDASRIIADTQRAQIFLLLGRYEEARQLLISISTTHPEVYSARRLLALLSRKIPRPRE